MNHINDEILKKYIAGEIESDQEKYKILELNNQYIKTCEGKTLLASAEMTLVVGGKNSGKSKLVNYLIKQILVDNCDEEFNIPNPSQYKVVSFDSEMGLDRLVQWCIKSPFEDEYGKDYLNNLKDKFFVYSLKRISPEARLNYISETFKSLKSEHSNAHFIICLDVGTCLTSDTNSSSNAGLIDNLVNKLEGNTLIVTIHHSFKDESKNGIGMGSIGTALEKYCAIKLLVNPTDSQKRHKVEFLVSKYEDIDKEKDYFFVHTEKDTEGKISINGVSDSLGMVLKNKGNLKVDDDSFKLLLFEFINNSSTLEDRLQKNIIPKLIEKLGIKSSTIYNRLAKLKEQNIINEIDGELQIQ